MKLAYLHIHHGAMVTLTVLQLPSWVMRALYSCNTHGNL